jgi:predicted SAM-dependent methyltransferase
MKRQVNIGCGQTATPGWINYDNSVSVLLGRLPRSLVRCLGHIGLLSPHNLSFIEYCRVNSVKRASALSIPEASGTVDVVYSSHMLEHLDRREARLFLHECKRIMKPNGILRLVVPDLKPRIDYYYTFEKDGDRLLESFLFDLDKPRGLLNWLNHAVTGGRNHHWMYDFGSLSRFVESCGFHDSKDLKPGETTIEEPGALDLREHEAAWSLYLETRRLP